MKLRLERLRKNRIFMDNIKWDLTPQVLFKPRFIKDKSERGVLDEIRGFMFYIDYMDDIANLMLMKTYNLTSKTVGQFYDVPQDMIMKSVKAKGVRDIAGMYPIGGELTDWLKKELGIIS
jgi:hypothetical protein